jgi:CheY-like chemotaxis protein
MIVDDLDYNRYFLKKLIQNKYQFKIVEAINGDDCFKKIVEINQRECCKGIQVIFMDVEMPIMNGIEATKKIKNLLQESVLIHPIQIVGITAYTDEEENCLKAGMLKVCKNVILPN